MATGSRAALQELSPQQRAFVRAYLQHNKINKGQAAIDAGYSPKTAGASASRLLKQVKIQEAIEALEQERDRVAMITPEWVRSQVADIIDGEDVKVADKLKAIELLAKLMHLFDKPEVEEAVVRVELGAAADWAE